MIIILIQVLIAVILLAAIVYVVKRFFPRSEYKKCPKCNGKGYWEAVRSREPCDLCAGSGKVHRSSER